MRLVIAEDDPAIRELLREQLEGLGHEVMEAKDGEEALEQVERHAPELVILDIQMPRLDGFKVLQRLRQAPHSATLPVMALTAFAMEDEKRRALDMGFDAYLTKPIDLKLLRNELQRLQSRTLGRTPTDSTGGKPENGGGN